ncbi:enoyl-CoA hydratase-related protein [Xanthobacter versatilis]|uniref:enoyl-CoA hydratase-related protein n=1 Tax=Xanthobacter autotrophicus (strain ATCC BAA-1158 / Py2) TaxID=78245 RepID=UPI003728811E
MAESLLVTEPHPGVRLLTINRPDRRNALDQATYSALSAALEAAGVDDGVRAVVLTGAGGCFTAGNDLADFQDMPDEAEPVAALAFLDVIARFPKPLVAAVEGFAIGIGTTMLLHCDLAYAGETARFRLPFVNLGLCPEGASSYLLPLVAGTKRAAELLLLGAPFGAAEAQDAGLVNAVTEEGAALALAMEKAVALAALPPRAVAVTKRLLRHGTADAVANALAAEAEQFRALRLTPAAQTAFAAFFKK